MRRFLLLVSLALGLLVLSEHLATSSDVEAGTAIRLDLDSLFEGSDLVLEGRIGSTRVLESAPGRIETEYTLQVDRTFWGSEQAQRVVRMPGGVLPDGRGLILSGMPELRTGEDALLFLSAEGDTGVRMPVGLAQGKLRISSSLDGRRVLVGDRSQLSLASSSGGGVQEAAAHDLLDYAETVAELYAAAERRSKTGTALRAGR